MWEGVVRLSGQIALNSVGMPIEEQTREVLGTIDALLAEAGTDRTRIVSAQVLLADIRDFDSFDEVWRTWVAGQAPARTTAQARLGRSGWAIEITVVAAVGD